MEAPEVEALGRRPWGRCAWSAAAPACRAGVRQTGLERARAVQAWGCSGAVKGDQWLAVCRRGLRCVCVFVSTCVWTAGSDPGSRTRKHARHRAEHPATAPRMQDGRINGRIEVVSACLGVTGAMRPGMGELGIYAHTTELSVCVSAPIYKFLLSLAVAPIRMSICIVHVHLIKWSQYLEKVNNINTTNIDNIYTCSMQGSQLTATLSVCSLFAILESR